ncbi:YrhA family protein [Pelosinus sp. IPA-1]|uniref:YrhA family protein n=1 Tax=Pelosinus sp. IPA-1 TaxID=3029569 RepID=UPI002436281E|nr:YrhA family protein [Pelosinus sp. IPA-1]GMA98784.1 SMI1/KNR4 family protein [Pelosinus sp. IPA-1]
MWNEQLSQIRKVEEKYGDSLNVPASNEQIEFLKKSVKERLNHILPDQYINFLQNVNGIDFNGFIIYGVDSFLTEDKDNPSIPGYIETNELWYENDYQKQYMFFGDTNISWYCLDITKGIYVELDKPSGTLMHEFKDFDSMLEKALKDSLI